MHEGELPTSKTQVWVWASRQQPSAIGTGKLTPNARIAKMCSLRSYCGRRCVYEQRLPCILKLLITPMLMHEVIFGVDWRLRAPPWLATRYVRSMLCAVKPRLHSNNREESYRPLQL